MSARSQARRDAEFDRLVECSHAGMDGAPMYKYMASAMRAAYEMGKRHGREEGPRWVQHPDCFGSWLAVFIAPDGSWQDTLRVNVKRGESVAEGPNWRYFGPIPADEVKA